MPMRKPSDTESEFVLRASGEVFSAIGDDHSAHGKTAQTTSGYGASVGGTYLRPASPLEDAATKDLLSPEAHLQDLHLPKKDEALRVLRRQLQAFYRKDESEVVTGLLEVLASDPDSAAENSAERIQAKAHRWVKGIRQARSSKNGVDALLNEFSLSSDEGIALMRLAEALLRVPDSYTMDRLMRDKLAKGNWSSHLGNRDSLFVNASTWGLLLAGKLASYKTSEVGELQAEKASVHTLQQTMKNTLACLGAPVTRKALRSAMQLMGSHFVMGKTMRQAISKAQDQEAKGYRYSFDMLGEAARTQDDADRYWQRYSDAIHELGESELQKSSGSGGDPIASAGISVKLSALHPRYQFSQRERVLAELVPKLKELVLQAKGYGISLTIDAEEASRLDLSLDIIEKIARDRDLGDWQGFGLAIQAYQKRALILVDWVRALAQRVQRKMIVRLVKGAYWDSEIKWTQELGAEDYPVFTRKVATDVSYRVCAQKLLRYRDELYPQFATHNARTVATILEMDDRFTDGRRQGYEFQRLYGMGEKLYEQVMADEKVPCRIYAPVGEHADLLAYLVRRLLENGANSSFVNRVLNEKVSISVLLEDPLEALKAGPQLRHPDIPLPIDLYRHNKNKSGRQNSRGLDLTDRCTLMSLKDNLQIWWQQEQSDIVPVLHDLAAEASASTPLVPDHFDQMNDKSRHVDNRVDEHSEGERTPPGGAIAPVHENRCDMAGDISNENSEPGGTFSQNWVLNPADRSQRVGTYSHDDADALEHKLALAHAAFSEWSSMEVKARTQCLRDLAETLESQCDRLLGLCIKEAGKTLEDAVAEVREAVDFCRYYAEQAEDLMPRKGIEPRGVILCISPWNFPLAIFLGQVSAALATGNTVVAKPAEQTRLIALEVVRLMGQCGFPENIVQLLMVPGPLVGERVLPDKRIQGVMFTGSTDTGRKLTKALVERADVGIPLIAETGGQNVMVVDSTALPEQVVDDVITSGFRSAGQRCSALRVLFVQNEIADDIIRMLSGAMRELTIGDPALIQTDVGPVIDAAAKARLQAHCEYLDSLSPDNQLLGDDAIQTGLSVNTVTAKAWAKCLYRCQLPDNAADSAATFFAPCLYELSDVSVLVEEVFGPVVHVIRYAAQDLDKLIDKVNGLGFGLTMGIHSRIDSMAECLVRRAKVGNIYVNRNMIGAVVGVQPFGGRGLSGSGPKAGGPHYLKRLVRFAVNDFNDGEEQHVREGGEMAEKCVQDEQVAPRLLACRECVSRWQERDETWVKELLADALPDIRQLTELVGCGRLNTTTLIGPAGELNQLRLEARGNVAVVLAETSSLKDALVSTMAALLVGSHVTLMIDSAHECQLESLLCHWPTLGKRRSITTKPDPTMQKSSRLPTIYMESSSDLQPVCIDPEIQAVMVIGPDQLQKSIQQWLTVREDGMIPIIGCEPIEQRLLRLMVEKTVTINLSSAGGDAALMSLAL